MLGLQPRKFLRLELLVFVVGMATLGSEIAAARLMAPFFGASTIIWANTIAIVLVALSVGYWIGGRIADRHPQMRGLCGLVLVAALLLGLVPLIADPFLTISVKAFDHFSVGAFLGSLIGVLVLVALPVLMLGAVSPWALRLKVATVEQSGSTAGRMFAISTVGSLVGTFLAALLLIPAVGTQRTFLTFALLLALVAVWGIGVRWSAVPVALLALFLIPVGNVKAANGGKVIYETETEYQYARVVEFPGKERHLELNEGHAIHSLYHPKTVLTDGYWDGYLTAPFTVGATSPKRIAILGNGAGTVARAYASYFPKTEIDAVELDAKLLEIGRRYFGLEERPQLHLHAQDARPFLRKTKEKYDAIFVDAYRQPYIPFYLTTKEFFATAREHLRPGGVVVVNVGHPESSAELEQVLTSTIRSELPYVVRDPFSPTNSLVIASDKAPSNRHLWQMAQSLHPDLNKLARLQAVRLRPGLEGGKVYTDDHAPVEWLIDKSIVEFAAKDGKS